MPATYSLIVMTYNRPEGLRTLLASIERQGWEADRLEVIVVDDGSSPPLQSVVEPFRARLRIRYHYQVNAGVSAARNQGISLATGDHIGFLADDYRLPECYLDEVDDFFQRHPSAKVVSFNVRTHGASLLKPVQDLYFQLFLQEHLTYLDETSRCAFSFKLPASRAAVFQRSVFVEVGVFDERLRGGEDAEFARQLARRGIPVFLLVDKFVEHDESLGRFGYLEQKFRYGRSYIQVMWETLERRPLPFQSLGWLGIPFQAALHMALWWPAAGKAGLRLKFLTLSPFLYLFLCASYLGAVLELKRMEK